MSTKVDWHYCGEPTEVVDGVPCYDYPTKSGFYLVTYHSGFAYGEYYDADRKKWDFGDDWAIYDNFDIIAWAELPEPYRPETKNE